VGDLLGIDHPIVQTGMGFVAGAALAAATSTAGGLGIIAGATMQKDELADAIAKVKDRTDRPFGVNLRSDQADVDERVDLQIRSRVRVASFALAPREDVIKRLEDAGVMCMPSVGALRHAEKVAGWGVDAVIVQGGEGGGHTGPVPTTLLLPSVVDAVDIPVVAAGGFFDGRGLVAALAYGAQGVAMGTRFLLTAESPVPHAIKERYLAAGPTDTVVTARVDGHPHRMLRTPFIDAIERSGVVHGVSMGVRNAVAFKKMSGERWRDIGREGWALRRRHGHSILQVLTAANAPMLCRAAMVDGRDDIGILSTGQVAGVIDDLPTCAEVINRVMDEAAATLDRLSSATARAVATS
jgi:NAD(P)H-dependent flavin oxidoreductase YrpB (nitropropane dioxygenase family)